MSLGRDEAFPVLRRIRPPSLVSHPREVVRRGLVLVVRGNVRSALALRELPGGAVLDLVGRGLGVFGPSIFPRPAPLGTASCRQPRDAHRSESCPRTPYIPDPQPSEGGEGERHDDRRIRPRRHAYAAKRELRLRDANLLGQTDRGDRVRCNHSLHHLRFEAFRVVHNNFQNSLPDQREDLTPLRGGGDNFPDTGGPFAWRPELTGPEPTRVPERRPGGFQRRNLLSGDGDQHPRVTRRPAPHGGEASSQEPSGADGRRRSVTGPRRTRPPVPYANRMRLSPPAPSRRCT